MMECFGPMIAGDKEERSHRFIEEALELIQACGTSKSEALQLVDYVFNRPVGETSQEVGGVMVTLAALCLAHKLDMHQAAETELARIWTKVEQIRAKQAAKPKHSPLPEQANSIPALEGEVLVAAVGLVTDLDEEFETAIGDYIEYGDLKEAVDALMGARKALDIALQARKKNG
jgi:NTP pyrophosphatase (non-canonical NTP hydrolase)